MEEENDEIFAEIEDISEFGPKSEFCRGNGECKLYRNRITDEIVCGVCDTMFSDTEEDEEAAVEEEEQYTRPPLAAMFDEEQLREKSMAEKKLEFIDSRIANLDTKLDVIIEFLQKNVTFENKPLEQPVLGDGSLKHPIKVSRAEVMEFLTGELSDRPPEIDGELLIDVLRSEVNKKFGTRFKNKGIENLIKEIRDARGN